MVVDAPVAVVVLPSQISGPVGMQAPGVLMCQQILHLSGPSAQGSPASVAAAWALPCVGAAVTAPVLESTVKNQSKLCAGAELSTNDTVTGIWVMPWGMGRA